MVFGQRQLNGPRVPAAKGSATHLMVLCHGYGADGNDLIGLAPHLQQFLPTVAFVAPNAPERCQGAGYQWFPISRLDPQEAHRGVESAAPALETFVDSELKRIGLPPERLVLGGFSQGTMMSLHVGLRRSVKPAAILGFSGMLTAPEPLPSLGPETPPILLIHGDVDTVIPPQALFLAAGALGRAGALVQWHLSRGSGHTIEPEGLLLGATFLAMATSGSLRRPAPEVSCPVG
ncbi:MAG TPA: phospholipase [Rhizomicrobium sp.]|nr:phospholipase [Rhizomicrobium sp.]